MLIFNKIFPTFLSKECWSDKFLESPVDDCGSSVDGSDSPINELVSYHLPGTVTSSTQPNYDMKLL